MNLVIEIIAATFFTFAAIFLLVLSFSLFQLHRIEQDDEELDVTYDDGISEEAIQNFLDVVKDPSAPRDTTKELEKLDENIMKYLTTGPEVFEHSYDLQLLYLAREGALCQFEENCNSKYIYYQINPEIRYAFHWGSSPQGHEYWKSLSENYENFLKGQE